MPTTDFPVTLSSNTVGALAIALPFVAVFIIGIIKGAFYKFAPHTWQAALPDKLVWPGMAGFICILASLILKISIGDKLFPAEWPSVIPWWLNAILSGIILAALSSKVIYPLMVEPAEKAKAKIEVAAAIKAMKKDEAKMPATIEPTPPEVEVVVPTEPTVVPVVEPTPVQVIEPTPVPVVEPAIVPTPVEIETEVLSYKTLLLTSWKPGLLPTHVLIERSDRSQKVIELSKYKETKGQDE